MAIDGVSTNGYDATDNPVPYVLADQFNHGLRHPDEVALFNTRVAAGLESADAPTFRLLLDDMSLRPALYRNAIVINLHGELFPFPPVRNYSDAAKNPGAYPNVRVVTHPERLRTGNGDPLKLRVYSYHTNVANPAAVADWLAKTTSPADQHRAEKRPVDAFLERRSGDQRGRRLRQQRLRRSVHRRQCIDDDQQHLGTNHDVVVLQSFGNRHDSPALQLAAQDAV